MPFLQSQLRRLIWNINCPPRCRFSVWTGLTRPSRVLKDPAGHLMNVELTDSAVQKLKDLSQKKREGRPFDIRLSVESGGCHGFQYHFEPLPPNYSMESSDIAFEREGVKVVIDEESLRMLSGAQIDYTQEPIGSQFRVIQNPMAGSGCGCGTSFEIKTPKK